MSLQELACKAKRAKQHQEAQVQAEEREYQHEQRLHGAGSAGILSTTVQETDTPHGAEEGGCGDSADKGLHEEGGDRLQGAVECCTDSGANRIHSGGLLCLNIISEKKKSRILRR